MDSNAMIPAFPVTPEYRKDNRSNIIKARAKAAKLLLEGQDIPPPVQEKELILARHLSTRYVPTQQPFSSLSCAKYLRVEHVRFFAQVFDRYSVIPTMETSPFLELVNGGDKATTEVEAAAPIGLSPLLYGDGKGAGGAGPTSFGLPAPGAGGAPLHSLFSKDASPSSHPQDTTVLPTLFSSPVVRPQRKQPTGEYVTELSADATRFTPRDLAISREWFVELMLCVVSQEIDAAAAAGIASPQPSGHPPTTHTSSTTHRDASPLPSSPPPPSSQDESVDVSAKAGHFLDVESGSGNDSDAEEERRSSVGSGRKSSRGTRVPSFGSSLSFPASHATTAAANGHGKSPLDSPEKPKKKPHKPKRSLSESFSFLLRRSSQDSGWKEGSTLGSFSRLHSTTEAASSILEDTQTDRTEVGTAGDGRRASSYASEVLSLMDPAEGAGGAEGERRTSVDASDLGGGGGGGLLSILFDDPKKGGRPSFFVPTGELPVGAPLPAPPPSPPKSGGGGGGGEGHPMEGEKKPPALHQAFGPPHVMLPRILGDAASPRDTAGRETASQPEQESATGPPHSPSSRRAKPTRRRRRPPPPLASPAPPSQAPWKGKEATGSLTIMDGGGGGGGNGTVEDLSSCSTAAPKSSFPAHLYEDSRPDALEQTRTRVLSPTSASSPLSAAPTTPTAGGGGGEGTQKRPRQVEMEKGDGKSKDAVHGRSGGGGFAMRREADRGNGGESREKKRTRKKASDSDVEFLAPAMLQLPSHENRRRAKEEELRHHRKELMEWLEPLSLVVNSHHHPLVVEGCALQVLLLERFHAASRQTYMRGKRGNQLFMNTANLSVCNNLGVLESGGGEVGAMSSLHSEDAAAEVGGRGLRHAWRVGSRPSGVMKSFLNRSPRSGDDGQDGGGGESARIAAGGGGGGGQRRSLSAARRRRSSAKDPRAAFIQELFMTDSSMNSTRATGMGRTEMQMASAPPPIFYRLERHLQEAAVMKEFVNVSAQYIIPLVPNNTERLQEELLTSMFFFGERANGKGNQRCAPHWADLVNHMETIAILASIHRERPISYPQGKRRKAKDEYPILCWSDLTSNLIMDFEKNQFPPSPELMYTRVQTMMLEEDNSKKSNLAKQGISRVLDHLGVGTTKPAGMPGQHEKPELDAEDDDLEDGEDGDGTKDYMTGTSHGGGGRRPRTSRRKHQLTITPTSVQADLETFAEELKGLHTQSADRILISVAQPSIITSSKDGVIKVWEPRYGHFTTNVLNVGSAWVLGMWLLHADQYMLVATSNAELTILEFPKGAVVQKFRGCMSLISALRQVSQMGTAVIHRYGLRPGECGPHRTDFKKNMGAEEFKSLFREAQITDDHFLYPAKPMEGYVSPSAVYFDPSQGGLFFFGNAEGAVGYFDLTQEVKQSTILSGSNTHPIGIRSVVHAHRAGVRVVGVIFVPSCSYVISIGEDGSIVRTLFTRPSDPHFASLSPSFASPMDTVGGGGGGSGGSMLGDLTDPQTILVAPRSVRLVEYCASHRMFATALSDRRVVLWTLTRYGPEFAHQFPPEPQDIISITFLVNESRVAFLTADRCIRIYDFRGLRSMGVIYPSKFADNNAEDVASVTLKCSREDADGCIGYLPKTRRLVCALRGPVMYERTKVPHPLEAGDGSGTTPPTPSTTPTAEGGEKKTKKRRGSRSSIPSAASIPLHIVTTASIKAGLPLLPMEDSGEWVPENDSASSSSSVDGAASPKTNHTKKEDGEEGEESSSPSARRHAKRRLLLREVEERRLQRKRLRPHTTLEQSGIAVVLQAAVGVVHTFSPRHWKSWDVLTGALIREVRVTDVIHSEMPMFGGVRMTSCGWTTEQKTRLLAGARNGHCVVLDVVSGAVVEVEKVVSEARLRGEPLDKDVSSVFHEKKQTFICAGRTIVVRRYNCGAVRPSGEELFSFITLRIPVKTTITACCVTRGSHFCVGTIDTKLYFFRLIDLSGPYHEEDLHRSLTGSAPPPTAPNATTTTTTSGGEPPVHATASSSQKDLEIGSVVGMTFVNNYNQNLLFILLDTGVLFVYSTLRACFLARFPLLRPGICRIRCFTSVRNENCILMGTTTGHVLGLDLSQCNSAEVDFKHVICVLFWFRAATCDITGVDTLLLSSRAIDRIVEDRQARARPNWRSSSSMSGASSSSSIGSGGGVECSGTVPHASIPSPSSPRLPATTLGRGLRKKEPDTPPQTDTPVEREAVGLGAGMGLVLPLPCTGKTRGGAGKTPGKPTIVSPTVPPVPLTEKAIGSGGGGGGSSSRTIGEGIIGWKGQGLLSPRGGPTPLPPTLPSSPTLAATRYVVVSSVDGNVRLFCMESASLAGSVEWSGRRSSSASGEGGGGGGNPPLHAAVGFGSERTRLGSGGNAALCSPSIQMHSSYGFAGGGGGVPPPPPPPPPPLSHSSSLSFGPPNVVYPPSSFHGLPPTHPTVKKSTPSPTSPPSLPSPPHAASPPMARLSVSSAISPRGFPTAASKAFSSAAANPHDAPKCAEGSSSGVLPGDASLIGLESEEERMGKDRLLLARGGGGGGLHGPRWSALGSTPEAGMGGRNRSASLMASSSSAHHVFLPPHTSGATGGNPLFPTLTLPLPPPPPSSPLCTTPPPNSGGGSGVVVPSTAEATRLSTLYRNMRMLTLEISPGRTACSTTVGLFGCDEWDLSQPSSFAGSLIPPFSMTPSHASGESFLNEVLWDAKLKSLVAEGTSGSGGVPLSGERGTSAPGSRHRRSSSSSGGVAVAAAAATAPSPPSVAGPFLAPAGAGPPEAVAQETGGNVDATFMTSLPSSFAGNPIRVPTSASGGRGESSGGGSARSERRHTASSSARSHHPTTAGSGTSGRRTKKTPPPSHKTQRHAWRGASREERRRGRRRGRRLHSAAPPPPVEAGGDNRIDAERDEAARRREWKRNFCRGMKGLSSRSNTLKQSGMGASQDVGHSFRSIQKSDAASRKKIRKRTVGGWLTSTIPSSLGNAMNEWGGEDGGGVASSTLFPFESFPDGGGGGNLDFASSASASASAPPPSNAVLRHRLMGILPHDTRGVVPPPSELSTTHSSSHTFHSSMGPPKRTKPPPSDPDARHKPNPLLHTYLQTQQATSPHPNDGRFFPESSFIHEVGEDGVAGGGGGGGGGWWGRGEAVASRRHSSGVGAGVGGPAFAGLPAHRSPLHPSYRSTGVEMDSMRSPVLHGTGHPFPHPMAMEGGGGVGSGFRQNSYLAPPIEGGGGGLAGSMRHSASDIFGSHVLQATQPTPPPPSPADGAGARPVPREGELEWSRLETRRGDSRGTPLHASPAIGKGGTVFRLSKFSFSKGGIDKNESSTTSVATSGGSGHGHLTPTTTPTTISTSPSNAPTRCTTPSLALHMLTDAEGKLFPPQKEAEGTTAPEERPSPSSASAFPGTSPPDPNSLAWSESSSDSVGAHFLRGVKSFSGEGQSRRASSPSLGATLGSSASRAATFRPPSFRPHLYTMERLDGSGTPSPPEGGGSTSNSSTRGHFLFQDHLQDTRRSSHRGSGSSHPPSIPGSGVLSPLRDDGGGGGGGPSGSSGLLAGQGEAGSGASGGGRTTVTFSPGAGPSGFRSVDGSASGYVPAHARLSPCASFGGGGGGGGEGGGAGWSGETATLWGGPVISPGAGAGSTASGSHFQGIPTIGSAGGETTTTTTTTPSAGGSDVYDTLKEVPREVLEQRRDQLMLAFMAQRLDKIRAQGHPRHGFLDDIKRVWVRRVGEAHVVAETRAAVLAATTVGDSQKPPGSGSRPYSGITQITQVMNQELQKSEAGGRVEVNLNLLTIPTEVRSTQEASAQLSARERLKVQLKDLQKQREKKVEGRHQREERNPNPRDKRYWLPLISSKQPIHPIRITLPSTLQSDEGARHQLRQLHQLVTNPSPTVMGSTFRSPPARRT